MIQIPSEPGSPCHQPLPPRTSADCRCNSMGDLTPDFTIYMARRRVAVPLYQGSRPCNGSEWKRVTMLFMERKVAVKPDSVGSTFGIGSLGVQGQLTIRTSVEVSPISDISWRFPLLKLYVALYFICVSKTYSNGMFHLH